MGYSNNKWRKILTILMIVNLFFILFAKISRVFAMPLVTFDTARNGNDFTLNNYTLKLPSFVYDYEYIIITFNQGTWTVIFSNNELIYGSANTAGSSSSIGKHFSVGTKAYLVNNIVNGVDNLFYRQTFNGYNLDKSNITLNDFQKIYSYSSSVDNSPDYQNVYYSSNFNVYDIDNNILNEGKIFSAPYFDNVTEIRNGYPDGVYISRGDYSEDETLYFHLLKITYTVTDNNNTIYYYSPKIFALDKNSKYYYTWDQDTDNKYSYYYVSRASLGLDTNSSYLYVLSNSSESFTNSNGIIQKDVSNGIYDVVQSDTTGVITSQDSTNDKIQNIDDTLNDNTVSSDTETNIEDSLNFDNQNENLNNLNNGFFSRLTSMLSNLLGYNLGEDTFVSLPLPNSNKFIVLHSKDIYDNVTGALRLIINAYWIYIFSFYMWKFINKIYIAVSTGNILDTFSSSGEAITNDML